MLDVDSYFLEAARLNHSRPIRRLFMDVSTIRDTGAYQVFSLDASDRVLKWPSFKHDWNRFAPNNTTIELTNADQAFNVLHMDGLSITRDVKIQLGYSYASVVRDPEFLANSYWGQSGGASQVGSKWQISQAASDGTFDFVFSYPENRFWQSSGYWQDYGVNSGTLYYGNDAPPDGDDELLYHVQSGGGYLTPAARMEVSSFGTPYDLKDALQLSDTSSSESAYWNSAWADWEDEKILSTSMWFAKPDVGSSFVAYDNRHRCYDGTATERILRVLFDPFTGSHTQYTTGLSLPNSYAYSVVSGGNIGADGWWRIDLKSATLSNSNYFSYNRVFPAVGLSGSWPSLSATAVGSVGIWRPKVYKTSGPFRYRAHLQVSSFTSGRLSLQFRNVQDGVNKALVSSATPATYGESFDLLTDWLTIDSGTPIPDIYFLSGFAGAKFFVNKADVIAEAYSTADWDHWDGYGNYIDLFQGNVDRVAFQGGRCKLSVTDKWDRLTHRVLGSDDIPVLFSDPSSTYYAHDIAWTLVTCYGGYDSTSNDTNPDIDWSSFNSWTAAMSLDAVRMAAEFRGEKVSEGLTILGKLTDTAIYVDHGNKLSFKRFSIADTLVNSFTPSELVSSELVVDETNVRNRIYVAADYDVSSDLHATIVTVADTASVNSFGLYEETLDNEVMWFVGSTSAQGLGQRLLRLYGKPHQEIGVGTTLFGLNAEVGDVVAFADPLINVAGAYRVLTKKVDLNKMAIDMDVHNITLEDPFILDVSSLDGTDILL